MSLDDLDRWIYRLVDTGAAIILCLVAVIVVFALIIGLLVGIFGR